MVLSLAASSVLRSALYATVPSLVWNNAWNQVLLRHHN